VHNIQHFRHIVYKLFGVVLIFHLFVHLLKKRRLKCIDTLMNNRQCASLFLVDLLPWFCCLCLYLTVCILFCLLVFCRVVASFMRNEVYIIVIFAVYDNHIQLWGATRQRLSPLVGRRQRTPLYLMPCPSVTSLAASALTASPVALVLAPPQRSSSAQHEDALESSTSHHLDATVRRFDNLYSPPMNIHHEW